MTLLPHTKKSLRINSILLLHSIIPKEKEMMGVQCYGRLLLRLIEYIKNTKVGVYPNSIQKSTNE